MQTANSTTKATILSYFPEQIQAALKAYGYETNLSPESVVYLAIAHFLETADIEVGAIHHAGPETQPAQTMLAHLPHAMQKGIEQYATDYEFPPEFVVELAVTFLLDPDASSFEDCQVGVQREQVYLLQRYRKDYPAEAA